MLIRAHLHTALYLFHCAHIMSLSQFSHNGVNFGSLALSLDPVHTRPDPYVHHVNLTSFKTSMTLKFVIILQNLIKTYHRKSGKSKCDRKVTELNVEISQIRSRVSGVLNNYRCFKFTTFADAYTQSVPIFLPISLM